MENIVFSKEKRCRACLKPLKRKLHCIESKTVSVSDQSQVELIEIYNECTQIVYDAESDDQWKWVCDPCFSKLVDFYHFRRMCIESYASFKVINLPIEQQTVDDVNVKIEAVELPAYLYEYETNSPEDEVNALAISDVKTDKDISPIDPQMVQGNDELEGGGDEPFDSVKQEDDDNDSSSSSNENQVESDVKPESKFACDLCPKIFRKKHRFDAHKRKHLGLKQWQCEHCDKSYAHHITYKTHLSEKHYDESKGRPMFICDVEGCGKTYPRKESLRMHISKIHIRKPLKPKVCEQCGKTFKNTACLVKHPYTHTKVTPYKCDICSKMFPTNQKLKEHTMRHDGIKNYVCPTCGLRKITGHELRVHMRIHSSENPNEIPHLSTDEQLQTVDDVLDVKLNEDSTPIDSQVIQESDKFEIDVDDKEEGDENDDEDSSGSQIEDSKLVCDICSQVFYKKHRFDAHKRKHLGLKQWQCEHCDKSYAHYITYKTHLSEKHYDESKGRPMFVCDVEGCGKTYPRKESLRLHISKIHLQKTSCTPRICEKCGKTFKNAACLSKHYYTHTKVTPHKCHICSKMFPTKHKLKEHIMRHVGIKNFVCPTCGLRKTTGHELRVHMKIHSIGHFPCELCSSVFTRQDYLKRHVKIVHQGIKAYQCPHCDRSFGKSDTLKHHVMTHTGERPNKCEICDKRFIQVTALKTHMKTHNKQIN